MHEITANLNWLAVGVGTIAAFLLGWLWYSPKLFGTKWAQGVGIELDAKGPSSIAMVLQFSGTFLLAWVIGVTAAANALLTAILVIFTIALLLAASGFFCRKSGYAIATETGFVVIMSIIMIVCQGLL